MVGNMVYFDTLEEFAEGRRLHEGVGHWMI